MSGVRCVEDLEVFKRAHGLTLKVYEMTATFPVEEKFGLSNQMRRACSSICANLAEGGYRNNSREFKQFAGISRGSAGEVKYFLLLAKDLRYIDENAHASLARELEHISKMLNGLIVSLGKKA